MSRRIFTLLVVLAVLAVPVILKAANRATADVSAYKPVSSAAQEQPVLAAMFYSNWCGACQILDPKIEAVKPAFEGHAVDFIKFDFSYAMVRGKAIAALAAEKGVPHIYAKNKGRTGFMLLIDPATETVLDIITLRDSKDDIAAKIERSMHRPAPKVVNEAAA